LFMAFPFETLDRDAAAEVMARTVGWLSWLGASTWHADRRVVEDGDVVTMTCVLDNNGWTDIAAAYLTTTLPADLEMVGGSPSGGITYYAPTRTVRWQGSIARGESITSSFQVRISESLSDATDISFPLHIGYADHSVAFDLPYILRVNASDLSFSTLEVEPASSLPSRVLSYTLAVRNTGVRAALAALTATIPNHTTFVDPLNTGGIGTWQVVSDVLSWTGPVAAGSEVVLNYQLELDYAGDYLLRHVAHISDQYGERWHPESRATIWIEKAFFPLVYK